MEVVAQTDRPKSVRKSCVIEGYGRIFVLFFDCFTSDGFGAFVLEVSEISFFFSSYTKNEILMLENVSLMSEKKASKNYFLL